MFLSVVITLVQVMSFTLRCSSGDALQLAQVTQHETKRNICFYELGCFSLEYPWDTLWGYLPQDPRRLNTKFLLTTRNLKQRRELTLKNVDIMSFQKPLVMIVHGFASSSNTSWVRRMEAAFLNWEDANVITVDWEKGASGPNYFQAIANMRVVAAEISRFLSYISKYRRASVQDMQVLGQSMGAHLVSYVRISGAKLPYITGLDPAQPWFLDKSTAANLDETDADFVVIVHTNTKPFWPNFGLGIVEPAGHVDFYINGGSKQPGCVKAEKGSLSFFGNQLNSVINALACSHLRAQEYLIEAMHSNCSFWGVKWSLNESEPQSNEVKCTPQNCQEMGKFTALLPGRGSFFVKTNESPPYCGNFYRTSASLFKEIHRNSHIGPTKLKKNKRKQML